MSEHISLSAAAERLGVHYMTAYRYIRTGRLPAEKSGGQWSIDVDELERFASPEDQDRSRSKVLPSQLEARLLAGDEQGAWQVIEGAQGSGAGVEEVYLELVAPAMTQVGVRWATGEITVADEHVATATAMRVIGRLGSNLARRGRSRGVVLLAGVPNDHHTLPTALLRDLLRVRGFDVQDLGANTPAESVLERASGITDLIAVGLAATHTDNEDVIGTTLTTLSEGLEVPIVVGGPAIQMMGDDPSLGPCLVSSSARHALQIFEDLSDRDAD